MDSNSEIDLSKFRIDQSHLQDGVKNLALDITARTRAPKKEFIRVRAESEYRWPSVMTVSLPGKSEEFLVAEALAPELDDEGLGSYRSLYTAITRDGKLFVWSIALPRADGFGSSWHTSARLAAEAAMDGWVRVYADKRIEAYVAKPAPGKLADPVWPAMSFDPILRAAYKGRFIVSRDDPVLRQLRGEA